MSMASRPRLFRLALATTVLSLCLAVGTGAAAAPAAGAAAPVLGLQQAVEAAVAKPDPVRRKAIRAALVRAFDLDAVSRSVLGEQAATAAQRARLAELILNRVTDRVAHPHSTQGGSLVVLRSRDVGQGETMVTTQAREGQGNPVTVVWRVRQEAGGPRVVDVLREGISLSMRMRKELAAAMKGHTLDQALAAMERSRPAD
jgi:phospholipid transport system substrate-binding protein